MYTETDTDTCRYIKIHTNSDFIQESIDTAFWWFLWNHLWGGFSILSTAHNIIELMGKV